MKPVSSCFIRLSAVLFLACIAIAPLIVRAAPGDLYGADNITGEIFRLTPEGTKTTFVTGLHQPSALAFDASGNLFVAVVDTNNSILKFTPDGTRSTFASGLRVTSDLTIDSAGSLFVAADGVIFKFSADGARTVFASGLNPDCLAFDSQGNLFEGDGPSRIFKFTPDGATKTLFASIPSTYPTGLAFGPQGNLFMADANLNNVFEITPPGAVSNFAHNVTVPLGLAFNDKGELFVSSYPGTILKFTADGTRTTFSSGYQIVEGIAFEPKPHKLLNVSARSFVDVGDKALITGFIVGGSALANNAVVVRAIGPSLPPLGDLTPLQDPRLELRDASGAIIAANDNWEDTQRGQIIATGLAPSDPRESAIFATLPAGNYTAVVRGVNDATGIALAEVYNLH